MNKDELVGAVAKKAGITKIVASKAINALQLVIVEECMDNDGDVNLPKLGKFKRRVIPPHKGYNPQAKGLIQLPEVHVLAFRTSSGLKRVLR